MTRCSACRDHLDEVRHSRTVWLAWRAPEPAEGFADRIVRRLEPASRAALRRRRIADLLLGAIPVPRIAAALVLASLTLLAIGVVRSRTGVPTEPNFIHEANDGGRTAPAADRPTFFQPTAFAGGSDATDSFSPALHSGERGTLKRALRGDPNGH